MCVILIIVQHKRKERENGSISHLSDGAVSVTYENRLEGREGGNEIYYHVIMIILSLQYLFQKLN